MRFFSLLKPVRLLGFTLLATLCAVPSAAFAQFGQLDLPGIESSVVITVSPLHPRPHDTVSVALKSTLIDLDHSSVEWRINGKLRTEHDPVITVVTGDNGQMTSIDAVITAKNGSVASASETVTPSELDLLTEAESYIPPFFGGRAQTSQGSTIRAYAHMRIKDRKGVLAPESSLNYAWTLNDAAVASASGLGKSSALFSTANFSNTQSIGVTVSLADGTVLNSVSRRIAIAAPQLIIYQDHPLLGILFNHAFSSEEATNDRSITIAAIPYFATVASPSDSQLSYDWAVNDVPVASKEKLGNEIGLNAPREGATAKVELSISHAANFFLDVSKTLIVKFLSQ